MTCRWIENPDTGTQEWKCDSASPPVPVPNPTPIPSAIPVWGWPTVKPSSEHITGTYTSMYSNAGKTYQHKAVDIGIPTGNKVLAPHAGTVVIAGWDNSGYGNLVKIVWGKFSVLLGHLSQVNVKVGSTVNTGDIVGLSGSTGNSTGPHIHFEVREGSGVIDPMQFYGANPKAGVPGKAGEPNPSPVPIPEFKPIAPDKNGVFQPTDPGNPLAKVGKKDVNGNWIPISSMPSSCEGLTLTDWPKLLACLQERAKQAALAGTGIAGSLAPGEIGAQVELAIANLFSIPLDPEEKKRYAARWIAGIVGGIMIFIAIKFLISLDPVTLATNPPAWAGKQTVKNAPKVVGRIRKYASNANIVSISKRASQGAKRLKVKKE